MRDWRNDRSLSIDARTVDIMAAAHNLLDVTEPVPLLSGFRSPETERDAAAPLRPACARFPHMQRRRPRTCGCRRAASSQIASAAAACKAGGVGRFSRSDFVHMDCGQVRSWGR